MNKKYLRKFRIIKKKNHCLVSHSLSFEKKIITYREYSRIIYFLIIREHVITCIKTGKKLLFHTEAGRCLRISHSVKLPILLFIY